MIETKGGLVDSSAYGKNCFGLSAQFLEASRRYAWGRAVLSRETSQLAINELPDASLLILFLESMSLECLMKALLEVNCKHSKEPSNLKRGSHNLFFLLKKVEDHLNRRRIQISFDTEERRYISPFENHGNFIYQTLKYGFLLTKDRKHPSEFGYGPSGSAFAKLCDKLYDAFWQIRKKEWETYKKENPYKKEEDEAILRNIEQGRQKSFLSF